MENLIHAVINEIERDFNIKDYSALDEMLSLLVKDENNVKILKGYLSDKELEMLNNGVTEKRY